MALSPTPFRIAQGLRDGGRLLALAGALLLGAEAEGGEVLVTIKPVHALVGGVMEGVGRPRLLIEGWASPHTYALRPSDARALGQARLIFWVGEALEAFLERPLSALAAKATIVKLVEAPGMTLHGTAKPGAHDPHIWLDPDNARAIVRTAAAALSEVDPINRETYSANAARVIERIEALDDELRAALRPVIEVPYIVAHDAYQYFGRRYGLNWVGAVTLSSERQPGARRIVEVRRMIDERGVNCLLAEPRFAPAIVSSLVDDTGIRIGRLDPLGADLTAGPDAWFKLMRAAARALMACLGESG